MSLILLLLFLFSNKSGSALNCYVTDEETLELDLPYVKSVVKNCTALLEKDSSCYVIKIEAETITELTTIDMKLQYCSLKNSCDSFYTPKSTLNYDITNVTCTECSEDLCNSIDSAVTINKYGREYYGIKENGTSSYRRNLYIGASGSGLVGVIGALLRCFCCRRDKNSKLETV